MNAASHPECGPDGAGHDLQAAPEAVARRLMQFASARADQLGGDLFVNPAWSILLDLFVASELGRRATVESVAAATNLSPGSAARWFDVLAQRGLVDMFESPDGDGRRLIRASESARQRLTAFLTEWR